MKKATPMLVPNPDWEESEDARTEVGKICDAQQSMSGGDNDFISYYPQDFGRKIEEGGAWIQVLNPPQTEYTVPPFSVWYAAPWPMDRSMIKNVPIKRVQIVTPKGTLGLFPREYSIVKDVREYLGREKDGILFHRLDGEAVLPEEALFYMQSRGIPRGKAAMMLLHQLKGHAFGWFEFAPQYGEHFGKEWPERHRCPFATARSRWKEASE